MKLFHASARDGMLIGDYEGLEEFDLKIAFRWLDFKIGFQ